jgi:hypothetical protein
MATNIAAMLIASVVQFVTDCSDEALP